MKFIENISVLDNIITYTLKAKYNDPLTSDEEQEIETLHDYTRKFNLNKIDFTGDVDVSSGSPTVAETASDSTSSVALKNVSPKEYVIDENMEVKFSIGVTRISDADLSEKINTKILMGQAMTAVFAHKVKEKISEILEQMRMEDNDFEGENETVL